MYRYAILKIGMMGSVLVLTATVSLAQKSPSVPNRSWFDLSGIVVSSETDRFTLDYSGSLITVEINKAGSIHPGEAVTVYGLIDNRFDEKRTLEASSVYVANRNTYYYANDIAEKGDYFTYLYASLKKALQSGAWMTVTGKVTKVQGREFTVDTGDSEFRIDTHHMSYNPLDDAGLQKIRKGDRVAVTGKIEDGLFEMQEIRAESILSLRPNQQKQTS